MKSKSRSSCGRGLGTILALSVLSLTGCATSWTIDKPPSVDGQSNVGKPYRTIKTAASGESTGFNILIIPLQAPTYSEAKKNLYASVNQSLEGKSIDLLHEQDEMYNTWYVLFSIKKLILTADVIEYTDSGQTNAAPVSVILPMKDSSPR